MCGEKLEFGGPEVRFSATYYRSAGSLARYMSERQRHPIDFEKQY